MGGGEEELLRRAEGLVLYILTMLCLSWFKNLWVYPTIEKCIIKCLYLRRIFKNQFIIVLNLHTLVNFIRIFSPKKIYIFTSKQRHWSLQSKRKCAIVHDRIILNVKESKWHAKMIVYGKVWHENKQYIIPLNNLSKHLV